MPGRGRVPARRRLSSAWAMMRSSAGSALISASFSALASLLGRAELRADHVEERHQVGRVGELLR